MPTKHITATDLYNFRVCRYRPFMDYNGDQAIKVEIHPLVKLLWEAGVQYESKVIESLKKDNSDKIFVEIVQDKPTSEALVAQTLNAMKDGADYIYQGVLVSGNKMGRPDLLVKETGQSVFGGHHYYPMDIKLARVDDEWDNGDEKLKIEQVWQLHFYGDLLEQVQGVKSRAGYIYKTKSRKLYVNLFKTPNGYEQALALLKSYMSGNPEGVEPAIGSPCQMCEWKDYCVKWAEDKNDVSLLFYVGDSMKRGLNKLGIETIDDLLKQDPNELLVEVMKLKREGYFYPAVNEKLIHNIVQRANINKSQECVLHERIDFPVSDKEIHYDIEGDPTQDFIYLHGLIIVEKDKEPTYHSFFAEKYEDEGLITEQLFNFFRQHEGVPVYHYADYEKTTLTRLIKKWKLDDKGVFEMLFGENGTAIDLYKVITEKTDWPLTSYGIKSICKFLGFKWAASDASGAASIVWMNDYLAGDQSMKDKILQYNGDDCRATLFLKNKLIEMQKT